MSKTLSLVTLMLLALSLLSAGDYIIGSDTSTESYVPVYGYNHYGWSKFFYTAAEMQAAGFTTPQQITRLAFFVDNSPVDYVMDDQRVYMTHFYDSAYGSTAAGYPNPSTYTYVFNGSVTWSGPGWNEIVLTTPFNYDPS
ncbi:MAG TPA: hypothetical protein PLO35_05820, partial [Candidatus Cloacimonadota bacterium]|nr:hypothetical protein [Candidatus Cloacimonadota bacterium]